MSFDRWRQRVLPWGHIGAIWRIRLNLCILRPTRVHNRNGKWIGSAVFAQLTAESVHTLQWAPLSTRIALSPGVYGLPCNTWCFGPMRAHNPNGTSIGSAVFAQMTAECPYTGLACFPSKLFLPMLASGPSSCNTWFIGPTQVRKANGNLILSVVFAGLTSVNRLTERQTDRQTRLLSARRRNNA